MSKLRGAVLLLISALFLGIAPAGAAPAISLTLTPSWITAERLLDSGISLRVEGLAPGQSVYPRLGDGEAPPAEADADGVAEMMVSAYEELAPGTYPVWVTDDDYRTLAEAEIRVTVLGLGVDGTSIVGTGFEPGQPVEFLLDGALQSSVTAAADGRVVITSTWAGEHDVVLRSAAGEIAASLSLRPALPPRPAPTPPVPGPQAPPSPAEQGQELLDALRSNHAEEIARRIDEQRERQDDLLGEMQRRQAELIARIEAEREAQIQLNLEAQRRAAERAAARYAAERDLERERDVREIAEAMRQAQERVERGAAAPIGVMRSTPRLLGAASVSADGVATVTLPPDASGEHHIALIDDESGILLAWVPITLESADGALPRVGTVVAPEALALAAALVLAGAAISTRTRRPRAL